MRALAASLAVHVVVVWLVLPRHAPEPRVALRPPAREDRAVEGPRIEEPPTEVELVGDRAPTTGGGHASARADHASMRASRATRVDPWSGVALRMESGGSESGSSNGNGNGNGNGFGVGTGGGIAAAPTVPRPAAPPPSPPSKARPARLLQPSRDLEVEDDDHLFVARVTVDQDGDVVAVRMTTTHPGVKGDEASSAIWSFRYAPALDDAGLPIRSTFEQPFQVR